MAVNNKNGIYKLPNHLKLKILENQKIQENLKTSWSYSLVPSLPQKMKIISILAKNSWKKEIQFSRTVLFHKKSKNCLKYFVRDCLCK